MPDESTPSNPPHPATPKSDLRQIAEVMDAHGVDNVMNQADCIDEQFTLCDLGEWTGRAAVTADAISFVREYADPAAGAWLPGVRVTFADAGPRCLAGGPI